MDDSQEAASASGEGAWNPGIGSSLTRELLALATIFRPENVRNDLAQAMELRDATGLALEDLAILRPERLALHEAIVRVAADFEIPDPDDADVSSLGVNFRRMVQTILTRVIEPGRFEIVRRYDEVARASAATIDSELLELDHRPPARGPDWRGSSGGLRSLWRRNADRPTPLSSETGWNREERVLESWTAKAEATDDPLRSGAMRALVRAASAVRSKHGGLAHRLGTLALSAKVLASNQCGSEAIGQLVDSGIDRIAATEGFRRLPIGRPLILMSTKGASAAGKSTMRPLQRRLAARLGAQWGDFALISPDIWRKALLDYSHLGKRYKYAGMLTSQELMIIDQKLDAYLVRKGERDLLPHLLLDRFRFDSFAPDSTESRQLVSRFAGRIFYFFMVTPPHETVERAWKRGLEVGRYKAVDDLLGHNVDAFRGMQSMVFNRALAPSDRLHYEFLDNDVPRGSVPLTAAFGWGGEMNILDVKLLLNMCRYQKINVGAKGPAEVYPDRSLMAVERNVDFLANCLHRFPRVNFALRATGRIYASFSAGRLDWTDADALAQAVVDEETHAALRLVVGECFRASNIEPPRAPEYVPTERYPTLGRWGPDAN